MKFGLAILFLFAAFVTAMAWSQEDMLFPAHAVGPADPLPDSAERISLEGPGGVRLHGVYIPPSGPRDGPRTLVLGFGGNAWNGENVASYLHELYPNADIAAFHYRGYRHRPAARPRRLW